MSTGDRTRLADYLEQIPEAIERCFRYTEDLDKVAFLQDEKTQDAIIRRLEMIGEASNNIRKRYPNFVQQHPEVPFGVAYEMRNVLTHGYFKLDLEILWNTIQTDLPSFYQDVRDLRDEIAGGCSDNE